MPYDRDNQNQANVSSAKYYMLREFPENFFEMIIIRMLETANVIRNVTSIMALTV